MQMVLSSSRTYFPKISELWVSRPAVAPDKTAPGDFASLVYKIALLIFIGGAVLALFRERVAEAFQAAAFWVLIGLLLALGYTYRHDLRDIGERVLAELVPGRAVSRGGSVEIARGQRGEFQVTAEINGARVATVYDTGASAVVL